MALKSLSSLPKNTLKINRALLSVSDKTGITELGRFLHKNGVELISTGGTAKALRDADLPVTDVSEFTSSQEILDGRVKTLHPVIHGGILARTSHQPDLDELARLNIQPIELVVVNLYPFSETILKPNVTPAEATEFIDIGGPTMIRAAAKNFAHVGVLSNPDQYQTIIDELKNNAGLSFSSRQKFARKAFEQTAAYDSAISNYFANLDELEIPEQLSVALPKSSGLRYGENPHQQAAVFGNQEKWIDCFHGKELSYNNYLDIDSALELIDDFRDDQPTVAIFKHTVPCGVATANSVDEAYRKAFATDTVSPFGGIVCSNVTITKSAAEEIDKIFTEIIIAPDFDEAALKLLKEKKNRRLVKMLNRTGNENKLKYRSIFGGVLAQEQDSAKLSENDLKVVTERKPTQSELNDLLFAWKVVKHIKSNAIVYVKDEQTIGVGTGQTSRVDSSEIAVRKAEKEGNSLAGSAIASDAFFPFADGVEAAAAAGAAAVIQPGGSVRDQEVIDAANRLNMTMVFTGIRHFKH